MGDLVLVRHGQTAWSANGRHTSYSDIDLTVDGERQAAALAGTLGRRAFVAVISSPRRRALRTAALARLAVSTVDDELAEWHYGEYEGITTVQIRVSRPGWDLWADGCPGGESPDQIGARADRVLARAAPLLPTGDVALVGHGHALRVLAARWAQLPVACGGRLRLDTGTLSVLGFEHERQVILSWNAPVPAVAAG